VDKGDIKHAERAGGYFSDEVLVGVGGSEHYGGKLVAIARDDDKVWDRVEGGEESGLLCGIGSP
jgi:hypothetical protein